MSNVFEHLNTLASEIAEEIVQRRRIAGDPNQKSLQSKLTAQIQRKLKQLEAEIALRDDELRKGGGRNQRDYHSKSGQLAVLSLRHEELRDEFLKDGGTLPSEGGGSVISNLFASKGEKVLQSQAAAHAAQKKELTKLDDNSLLRRKEELLAEQDKGFDILSETISRQKHIAISIGGEVDKHNTLLDKMATRVEKTDKGVRRETLRVADFTEDTSNLCPYYCFIIVLILCIVFVLALPSNIF